VTFTPHEARQASRLRLVILLVAGFFGLELAGAIAADSVVLQADALHLLMDVLALGVSLFAMRLAVRRPTPRFTYGLRRAEPVAAIFSAALVLGTTVFIVIEAVEALRGREPPRAGLMLVVASGALVVNGLSAWLLHGVIGHAHPHDPDNPDHREGRGRGPGHAGHAHDHAGHDHDHDHAGHDHGHDRAGHDHDHDHAGHDHGPVSRRSGHALNLRGAWLHLVGDTLGALAALVAAVVLRFWGQPLADPIASFIVAGILVVGALRLGRDATLVLLEAAPPHLPVERIRAVVAETPGVQAVHDLHVWTLGAGHDAITVHVRTDRPDPAFGQRLSDRIRGTLGAEYVTVQVECVPGSTEEP
jgi:cation diffusion facilitator family transporter